MDDGVNDACRRVERQTNVSLVRVTGDDQSASDGDRRDSNKAMAADRRVVVAVHEDNAGVRFGRNGVGQHGRDLTDLLRWFALTEPGEQRPSDRGPGVRQRVVSRPAEDAVAVRVEQHRVQAGAPRAHDVHVKQIADMEGGLGSASSPRDEDLEEAPVGFFNAFRM